MDHRDETDRVSIYIDKTNNKRKYTRQLTASRKRYVLEEYPSRAGESSEYNSAYDAFQAITPPNFNRQFQDSRGSIYDDPYSHYLDNGQQQQMNLSTTNRQRQYIPPYQKNDESPRNSEVEFLMDRLGGEKTRNTDVESGTQPKKSSRRHLLHNFFDFIAIAATCLAFGLIYLLIKPVQRGFFCDDTSIQYPFKPDTIPMWLLGIYGGIGPIVIFCIVETWVVRPFHCGRGRSKYSLKQRRFDYLITLVQTIFLFGMGIAICFLITEVGKRTIGRLRPYYLTVCNPIWANIQCTKTVTTTNGPFPILLYIMDHNCNSSLTPASLQEAKLSFPSGHSSYSTYAFVFLFVYLEARLVCPNIQFLKPFLQCLCIAIAFFTCLSRVTDYKHHSTDVIGGALIGFFIAVFAAIRVGTYLWSFSIYCETEEETEKDRLPKEERIPIPGAETKQSGAFRSNEQIELENMRQPPASRSRNGNRPGGYDNTVHAQQQKSISNPMMSGARRIVPGKAFDEANS